MDKFNRELKKIDDKMRLATERAFSFQGEKRSLPLWLYKLKMHLCCVLRFFDTYREY